MRKILFSLLVAGVSFSGVQGASAMEPEGSKNNTTKKRKIGAEADTPSQPLQVRNVKRNLLAEMDEAQNIDSPFYLNIELNEIQKENQLIGFNVVNAIPVEAYPVITATAIYFYNTRSKVKLNR